MQDYIAYWIKYRAKFLTGLLEHLRIVGVTLMISLLLAAVLTILIWKSRRVSDLVIQIFSAVYSIPSLALFSILIPFTGLGLKTTYIVLVLYNQYLLLRNIISGLQAVDPSITEAAVSMGMTGWRVLTRIAVPLAAPMILAGIRLAVISTIGIATIAASINAGGLGKILFDGMRTMNQYKIVGGTLLCALIALAANAILKLVERKATARLNHSR